MKWLPHIHRLQLHPHSEEVASQISMVLGKEQGGGTGNVSTIHQGGANTFGNLFEMSLCGFCYSADYQITCPPKSSWVLHSYGWKQPKMALIHPGGCLAPAGHQIQTCAGFHVP